MKTMVLLVLGWLGLVIYSGETTRVKDCPPPSARSVESLLAPCLEREQRAEITPALNR